MSDQFEQPKKFESPSFEEIPLLVQNYDSIREIEPIQPAPESFPHILDTTEAREHCFIETKKAWQHQINGTELKRHLEAAPDTEHFDYLKKTRKFGGMLRNVCRFFTPNHKSPSGLQSMVHNLGIVNEHYGSSDTVPLEESIMSQFNDFENEPDPQFTTNEDFKDYCRNLINEIKKYTEKSHLLTDEFHTLRKRLRMFANLIQVLAAERIGGPEHWLYYHLNDVSTRFGKTRDHQLRQNTIPSEREQEVIDITSEQQRLNMIIQYLKLALL